MNFSETFIRRPIATSLLMAAIALFGIVAYRALPVSDLPTVDFPTIQVQASLPGGDPGTMASAVASPLERQFTTIAGVDSMISSSSMGSSQVAAVRPGAVDRQRGRRRADRDRGGAPAAPAGHAGAADVPQAKSGGSGHPAARAGLEHGAALGARRLRRDDDRAADLDGERRLASAGLGAGEVCRARAGGSGQAPRAANRAERG